MQPQTYEQIYGNLNQIYEPQRQSIRTQQAQIPGMYQAQTSALEQAKVNAFRDISNAANQRGMYFSGFRPSEEATYTGTKFLPALAALKNEQLSRTNALQDALLQLNAKQGSEAQSNYTAQQNAWAEAQAKLQAAQIAAQARVPSSGSSSAAQDRPTLSSLFEGYDPKKDKWYTENVVIPTLKKAYGYSTKEAANLAYQYRAKQFGEGYGWMGR